MALHTLKIVVVDGGRAGNYSAGGRSATSKTTQKVDKESPLYKLLNAKEIIKEKTIGKLTPSTAYGVTTFGRLAMQTAKSAFSYYISDIGRSTGDSNYQARVNRAFEVSSQIMGVLGSTVSGATAGFMAGAGNPIGAVVGAVAGLASSAISFGFQSAEKARAYRQVLFEETNANNYSIARNSGEGFLRLR